MSACAWRSDVALPGMQPRPVGRHRAGAWLGADLPASVRARPVAALLASRDGARTRIATLQEGGGFRVKFPRSAAHLDAVIVNTGGGMAGGDEARIAMSVGAGAHLVASTAAAEKIYRALEAPARMDITLAAGEGAHLAWLPQETILFDGARLERRLAANLAAGASLTLCEMTVLGRAASGERCASGALRDQWDIRRAGRLIFAERIRLEGDIATALTPAAAARGWPAYATVLLVAQGAEERLEAARAILAEEAGPDSEAAASAWDGLLLVRCLAAGGGRLRQRMEAFLRGFASVSPPLQRTPLPRSWLT